MQEVLNCFFVFQYAYFCQPHGVGWDFTDQPPVVKLSKWDLVGAWECGAKTSTSRWIELFVGHRATAFLLGFHCIPSLRFRKMLMLSETIQLWVPCRINCFFLLCGGTGSVHERFLSPNVAHVPSQWCTLKRAQVDLNQIQPHVHQALEIWEWWWHIRLECLFHFLKVILSTKTCKYVLECCEFTDPTTELVCIQSISLDCRSIFTAEWIHHNSPRLSL